MTATDDPAMLDAQRRHKHAKRIAYVYRADARPTPTQQWDDKVRAVLFDGLDTEQFAEWYYMPPAETI